MIRDFRGKHTKDIETAAETAIFHLAPPKNHQRGAGSAQKQSVTQQQVDAESFDNYIEKRK